MNEDQLVGWLRRAATRTVVADPAGAGRSKLGRSLIGDDAAILPEDDRWAITVDSQIAGVHFPADLDPAVIARRAVAVNLSDLAAMGASPAYAFVALAAPVGFDYRRFFLAILGGCRRYGMELAGGDLARAEQLAAVLTLIGRRGSGRRWLLRGNAHPGEHLWLGGTVGEAAAGLRLVELGARLAGRRVILPERFQAAAAVTAAARRALRRQLQPQPQLGLGSWLATSEAGAAIDVSDGLARDLHRMCSASGVAAEIDLDRLPLGREFEKLARCLGCDWQHLALGGGEDYVLLFTLPAGIEPPGHFGCTRIGEVRARRSHREPEVVLVCNGDRSSLPALGWDHLQASSFYRTGVERS